MEIKDKLEQGLVAVLLNVDPETTDKPVSGPVVMKIDHERYFTIVSGDLIDKKTAAWEAYGDVGVPIRVVKKDLYRGLGITEPGAKQLVYPIFLETLEDRGFERIDNRFVRVK
jgi:hypothetical protein